MFYFENSTRDSPSVVILNITPEIKYFQPQRARARAW